MIKILTALFLIASLNSYGASPSLDGIDQTGVDNIGKEFAANFVHSSVMPPVGLGKVFGLEIGASAGVTSTPELEKLSSSSIQGIPHVALVGAVSVPMGFTGEITLLPEKSSGGVNLSTTSVAVRWDIGQFLMKSDRLKLAARVHTSFSSLSYTQIIQNDSTTNLPVNATINFDTNSFGAHLLAGADFFIFQPYLGLGFVSGGADLGITATSGATIFDQSFSAAQNATTSATSPHFLAGMQIDLLFIHLGFEYHSFFDTSKYTGKVSLAF